MGKNSKSINDTNKGIDLEFVEGKKDKAYMKHACGCRLKQTLEGNLTRWVIDVYCEQHTPNYKKKADKAVKGLKRKYGRGYTKPLKGGAGR